MGEPSRSHDYRIPIIIAISLCLIAALVIVTVTFYGLENSNPSITGKTDRLQADGDSTTMPAAPSEEKTPSAERLSALLDVPYLNQFPELPTGCEITSAAMVLDYYGYDLAPIDLDAYLNKIDPVYATGDDGETYGPDPSVGFIGDTQTEDGSFCEPEPIAAALDTYLEGAGSPLRARVITGSAPDDLYDLVAAGTPVVVWVTTYMQEYVAESSWYTDSGRYVGDSTSDHAMVLIGYDRTTRLVTLHDPIDQASVVYDMDVFEDVYESRGDMALIIR